LVLLFSSNLYAQSFSELNVYKNAYSCSSFGKPIDSSMDCKQAQEAAANLFNEGGDLTKIIGKNDSDSKIELESKIFDIFSLQETPKTEGFPTCVLAITDEGVTYYVHRPFKVPCGQDMVARVCEVQNSSDPNNCPAM